MTMKDCPICGGTGKLSEAIANIIESQANELKRKNKEERESKGQRE